MALLAAFQDATEAAAVTLRESRDPGRCTQVRIELKADGLFRPALAPVDVVPEAKLPKPLMLDVKTRFIFFERLLAGGGPAGERSERSPRNVKAVRWVRQAASAINGEVRPTASALRPDLALLVAEKAADSGTVIVVSPVGPLTRSELELVQGLGDPLCLSDLLPDSDVELGKSWKLPGSTARSFSGYDEVKSSTLEASLKSLDDRSAVLEIRGDVEGSVLGGPGKIRCEGTVHFDRTANLIVQAEIKRTENRQAGPIEAGLEVKSTLTVRRAPSAAPAELSDEALKDVPLDTGTDRQLLQLVSPDSKYNLLHDRLWHTYWDDPKLVVLKRIERGQVVAQCNLAAGPAAGKGRHQTPARFRDDIRSSLKQRFVQFLGAGEVDGDPAGGFRYKVGVQGREGDLNVLWNYYLIASPEGDQLLATFTMAAADANDFGDQDERMIGSLQWYATPESPPEKP